MENNIWEKCKVLTEFEPNRHVFEYLNCKQILNKQGVPCTMDMIRCDTGERVYFGGIQAGIDFFWVVEKYTVEVKQDV